MKKIISVVIFLMIVCSLAAQPPKFFKYQGIARDSTGNPVSNDTIALRISIHQGTASGVVVYKETHNPITNEFGSFNINVGGGTVLTGNFSTIAWGRHNYFQEVEMDIAGGSNYVIMGTSQYLSVPYALAADSAKAGIAPFWVVNDRIGVPGNDTSSAGIIVMANTPNSGAPVVFCKNFGTGTVLYAEASNGIFILSDTIGFETNGNAQIGGNTKVEGSLEVGGSLLKANTIQANTVTGPSGNLQVSGNLSVTGHLSKGSGSFKIDHPLDPLNKFLYHSFVESPEMKNIYDGTVITDSKGNAIVELPPYFEALNKDFRYQLTCIGVFAQAIIYSEIKNNSFRIRTNKPNIKVSWQVTGIRNDAYAKKHRIIPEVEKEAGEKGKYLYPDSFKQN